MGKSLLSDSVVKNLKKLNRNISYKVGKDQIDIEVIKVDKNSVFERADEKYQTYIVKKNGEKILEKRDGYTRGGWNTFDEEIFHLGEVEIKNDLRKGSEGYQYSKKTLCVKDNMIGTVLDYYEVLEDCVVSNCLYKGKVYFIPSTKEIGLLIDDGNIKLAIENPYEYTEGKVRKVFNDYDAKYDKLRVSILKKIKRSVAKKEIFSISETDYEDFEEKLNEILKFSISEDQIVKICEKIHKVEEMYSLYQDVEKHKKVLEGEISVFNEVLEKCLDKAMADEKAYKDELQKAQKALKKKYNI